MNKILVIKIGAIGDLLVATPDISAIKRRFNHASVYLLVGNWAKEIIRLIYYYTSLPHKL